MIILPDAEAAFHHENSFYLTCGTPRMAKAVAHWELFNRVKHLQGAIVECGVYKGASLCRFAMYREIADGNQNRPIVGFDSFGEFPETEFEGDMELRQRFIDTAGNSSISTEQLLEVLEKKNCNRSVSLVEGDICQTVPKFVNDNPGFRIALLNLDVDIYEPSVTVLEYLFPLIEDGGILILDDYNSFPGETKAADDYFKSTGFNIIPSTEYPSIYFVKKV